MSRYPEGSKIITLTQGYHTIVDAEDYEHLMQWSWSVGTRRGGGHVARRTAVSMHRYLMGLTSNDGKQVDHINGNPLDNRRSNLRITDNAGNQRNKGKPSNNTTGYKGIHQQQTGRWSAHIRVDKVKVHLGTFSTPEEAALAYNKAAIEYFGEFAHLNEISRKKVS